jgi:hypothetical protein
VRNPVLALPSVRALRSLDPATREMLRAILLDLRADARGRAEASWRTRKPPMAAYWAAVAVYAGHFARALGRERPPLDCIHRSTGDQ